MAAVTPPKRRPVGRPKKAATAAPKTPAELSDIRRRAARGRWSVPAADAVSVQCLPEAADIARREARNSRRPVAVVVAEAILAHLKA